MISCLKRFYSITKVEQCAKAYLLFDSHRYAEAAQFFQKTQRILEHVPKVGNDQIFEFYRRAALNSAKMRQYNLVHKYTQQICRHFPDQIASYYIPYLVSNNNVHELPNQDIHLRSAVTNIFQNGQGPIFTEIHRGYKLQQVSILYTLSNYLVVNKSLNLLEFGNLKTRSSVDLKFLINLLSVKLDLVFPGDSIIPKSIDIKQLVQCIQQHQLDKVLQTLSFLIYDSGVYDLKSLAFWANVYLKYNEEFNQYELYKPLVLLSLIFCDSKQYMPSEGLINTALDLIQNRPEQQVSLVKLSQSRLFKNIENRHQESDLIDKEYRPKYNSKQLLKDMLI